MKSSRKFKNVRAALKHVQAIFPLVKQVDFDKDGRWAYHDGNGNCPSFENTVDVGILEDAAYDLQQLPCSFILEEKTLIITA